MTAREYFNHRKRRLLGTSLLGLPVIAIALLLALNHSHPAIWVSVFFAGLLIAGVPVNLLLYFTKCPYCRGFWGQLIMIGWPSGIPNELAYCPWCGNNIDDEIYVRAEEPGSPNLGIPADHDPRERGSRPLNSDRWAGAS